MVTQGHRIRCSGARQAPPHLHSAATGRQDKHFNYQYGNIKLSGFVRSQDNIVTAMNVTRGVNGVKSVKNHMRLK